MRNISDQGDQNSVLENVIKTGNVQELKRRYEARWDTFPRSKSESYIITNEHQMYSDLNRLISNLNTQFVKKQFKVSFHPSTSTKKSKAKEQKKKKKNINSEIGPLTDSGENIIHKDQRKENIPFKNKDKDQIMLGLETKGDTKQNIGTIPRVTAMIKKPVPAPRIYILEREKGIKNTLQKTHASDENITIFNTSFIEADKCGNIENLRKNLLDVFDEKMTEMKNDHYDEVKSVYTENIYSAEEDDIESYKEESDSGQGEPSEDDLEIEPIYINFSQLICSKEKEKKSEINQWSAYEDVINERYEYPIYENIDESVSEDIEEPWAYKERENHFELNQWLNGEEVSNQTMEFPIYENIDDNFSKDVKVDLAGLTLKEEVRWNIPPEPDRSLKPSTSFHQSKKNIACSIHYNQADDKNEKNIIKTIKEENQKSWKNYRLDFDNQSATQSNNKYYDQTDDENYEKSNEKKIINLDVEVNQETCKNHPLDCDNQPATQSTNLPYDPTEDENYESSNEKNIIEIRVGVKREIYQKTWRNHLDCVNQPPIQSIKLSKIIQEFKDTEKRYIQELKDIIPVYTCGIKQHPSLKIRSQAQLICATIDTLLKNQKKFAQAIEESESSIECILRVFIEFEELFTIYKLCLGTNNSITITLGCMENDFQKEINLSSIINLRLTHYKMFLERIRDEVSKKRDSNIFPVVLHSLNTVMEIINSCNTMFQLATVQNVPLKTNKYGILNDVREARSSLFVQCCPFDVNGYGEFLLKDKFKIKKPFPMEPTVFLFNNIILFTMEQKKDTFYYHSHIKMEEVFLRPLNKKDILEFQHYLKSKQFHSPTNYKLKAHPKVVQKWREKIEICLWSQKLKIKEEQTERYQKTGTKWYPN